MLTGVLSQSPVSSALLNSALQVAINSSIVVVEGSTPVVVGSNVVEEVGSILLVEGSSVVGKDRNMDSCHSSSLIVRML